MNCECSVEILSSDHPQVCSDHPQGKASSGLLVNVGEGPQHEL